MGERATEMPSDSPARVAAMPNASGEKPFGKPGPYRISFSLRPTARSARQANNKSASIPETINGSGMHRQTGQGTPGHGPRRPRAPTRAVPVRRHKGTRPAPVETLPASRRRKEQESAAARLASSPRPPRRWWMRAAKKPATMKNIGMRKRPEADMTASQKTLEWASLKDQIGLLRHVVYESPAWSTMPSSIMAARKCPGRGTARCRRAQGPGEPARWARWLSSPAASFGPCPLLGSFSACGASNDSCSLYCGTACDSNTTENPNPRAFLRPRFTPLFSGERCKPPSGFGRSSALPRENWSAQFRRGDHDGQQTHSSHSRGSTWRCRAGAGISHGSQPDKPAVIGLVGVTGLSGGRLVGVAVAAGTAARPGDSRVGHVPGDERIGRLVT